MRKSTSTQVKDTGVLMTARMPYSISAHDSGDSGPATLYAPVYQGGLNRSSQPLDRIRCPTYLRNHDRPVGNGNDVDQVPGLQV